MNGATTLQNLHAQFLRLRQDTDIDLDAAEALEAQAAQHFKTLVDAGKIPWWWLSFPQAVNEVDGQVDPRITRRRWVAMWNTIYRETSERNPGQLPDRHVVTKHKVMRVKSEDEPEAALAVTQSKLHWPMRLEGDAALCAMLEKGGPAEPAPSIPLHGKAKEAADYIRENPGTKGATIAKALHISPEYFRSDIWNQLKPLGFYNKDGYRPPSV